MAGGVTQDEFRKYIAEFVGAFFLTMGGMLVLIGGNALIAVAAAQGAILGIMIYLFGPLSGGHFNPAISAAMFLQKKLDTRTFLFYMAFQVVGATVGALIAVSVLPIVPWNQSAERGATLGILTSAPTTPFFSPGGAFLLEVLMTFMLATSVSTIVAGGDTMSKMSGALIGGTLFACILFGGAFTGASLNPARSLGPAFVSGTNQVIWASIWLYIVGPFIGAALAAVVFMWFKGELKISMTTSSAPVPAQVAVPPAIAPSPLPPPPDQLPLPSSVVVPQAPEPPKPPA